MPFKGVENGETRFCQGAYAVTYDKQLIPAPGSKMLEGLPDLVARYQADDIRQGWLGDEKVVVCDLFDAADAPLEVCGRGLLRRTVEQWQGMGYAPKVGIELEAFAFVRDENGHWIPQDTPGAFVYSTGPFADPSDITGAPGVSWGIQ